MAKRLQEAEDALAVLQARGISSAGEVGSVPPSPSPQCNQAPRIPPEEPGPPSCGASAEAAPRALPAVVTSTAPPVFPSERLPANAPAPACRGALDGTVSSELSLDENGEIRYYGPTSAVHDPPGLEPARTQTSSSAPGGPSRAETRLALASLARESAVWEDFALENASKQTGIPRRMVAKLLHLHWTWVAPMFMWVCRPGE
jgi:hypothetical protein